MKRFQTLERRGLFKSEKKGRYAYWILLAFRGVCCGQPVFNFTYWF